MQISEYCPNKILSAQEAINKIKNGSRVFIGTACGEPQHLIRTMAESYELQDIVIYQMLSSTLSEYMQDDNFLKRFSLKLFFISASMRKAAFEGKIDYVPAYLSQMPQLFYTQRIGLDVALIQVSPPDRFGYCSLGISVDITLAGVKNSKLVIAQINTYMPRTLGDNFLHIDDIDHIIEHTEPLIEMIPTSKNEEVVERIAGYVDQLIEDGSTLQIGFGHLPDAILPYLRHKKDLGIHTQVITEGFLPLLKAKTITNKNKNFFPGRIVTSLCMGSNELYNYVDNNLLFYFRSSDFVNDPNVIALNDSLISISSALEVDLTGQVCTDSKGYLFYSGIGDQVDFIRGSNMSRGGFSIIALPSTAQDGSTSRIVPHLSEGAGVATTRGDIDIVITEYGIAELHGKGVHQRVMELAQIAHPDFREELVNEAKKRRYIFADQLPPTKQDLLFLENYKYYKMLRDNRIVEFRPLLPSDEFASRNFFYSLQETTVYYRFFQERNIFSREMLQDQWAYADYRNYINIIGLLQKAQHKEIIAIGTYAKCEKWEDVAEVAFVVKEELQDKGIGSFLIGVLENIAKENGFKGFYAKVLKDNSRMIYLFQKKYPHTEILQDMNNEVDIYMEFSS